MDQDRSREDPRVLRTRKLIEDAFLAVLTEKGFEDLSVQDVAERAGINRVTFYAHYADKYDLLSNSIRKSFAEELENRNLPGRDLSADSIRDLFAATCAYIEGLYGHCKPPHRHLEWMLREEITGYCKVLFCKWGEGTNSAFRPLASAGAGAMYALVLEWLAEKERGDAAVYIDSVLPIVTGILRIE